MVTTRSKTNETSKRKAEQSDGTDAGESEAKRPRSVSHDDEQKKTPKRASKKSTAPEAKCTDNQALINALQELVESVADAQSADPKLRFQAANLRKVISTLAEKETKITSGKKLASGDDKVKGLGIKTANFIDDFLKHGSISAIDYYHNLLDEYHEYQEQSHVVRINRAPVLTLWATVVYEKQGYTRQEALTHAKWISAILARSKGKSLGKIDDTSNSADGPSYDKKVSKVNAFGHIKVPVESEKEGKRFAIMGKSSLIPGDVEQYLENAFGGEELRRTREILERLADAIPDLDDLRSKAYDLYEKLRPEWQGWAQPGKFDLDHIEDLINEERAKYK